MRDRRSEVLRSDGLSLTMHDASRRKNWILPSVLFEPHNWIHTADTATHVRARCRRAGMSFRLISVTNRTRGGVR
jgi:hypothetical protein